MEIIELDSFLLLNGNLLCRLSALHVTTPTDGRDGRDERTEDDDDGRKHGTERDGRTEGDDDGQTERTDTRHLYNPLPAYTMKELIQSIAQHVGCFPALSRRPPTKTKTQKTDKIENA